MKIKTSTLKDAGLDWAVSQCMKRIVKTPERFGIDTFGPLFGKGYKYPCWGTRKYAPSINWNDGGPIIEREHISISHYKPSPLNKELMIIAAISTDYALEGSKWFEGPTPLIAAMRCYVASVLGDDVDVPEELVEKC